MKNYNRKPTKHVLGNNAAYFLNNQLDAASMDTLVTFLKATEDMSLQEQFIDQPENISHIKSRIEGAMLNIVKAKCKSCQLTGENKERYMTAANYAIGINLEDVQVRIIFTLDKSELSKYVEAANLLVEDFPIFKEKIKEYCKRFKIKMI